MTNLTALPGACQKTRSHPTRDGAQAQLDELLSKRLIDPKTGRVYYCERCMAHHVTSRAKRPASRRR